MKNQQKASLFLEFAPAKRKENIFSPWHKSRTGGSKNSSTSYYSELDSVTQKKGLCTGLGKIPLLSHYFLHIPASNPLLLRQNLLFHICTRICDFFFSSPTIHGQPIFSFILLERRKCRNSIGQNNEIFALTIVTVLRIITIRWIRKWNILFVWERFLFSQYFRNCSPVSPSKMLSQNRVRMNISKNVFRHTNTCTPTQSIQN